MNIQLIIGIIAVFGAILRYIVLPLLNQKVEKEDRETLWFWTKTAVHAAEQIYKERGQGVLKKENVLNFLKGKGYDITLEEINMVIEAVVKEMKELQKANKDVNKVVTLNVEDNIDIDRLVEEVVEELYDDLYRKKLTF